MAFSDFKAISEVLEKFRIVYTEKDFFTVEVPLNPSEQFLQDFEFCRQHIDVFASEAARCEVIIFPILKEIYKGYADTYALWIQKPITYDEILNGTPDYLISTKSELGRPVVGTPLILLAEAKKNDFEQGWGQCLAELVAAQKINDDPEFPVYGVVSDGISWQFGCLIGDVFTQNRTNFGVDNLPVLFGAINAVFKAALRTSY
ncbi:hypothetical protein F4Y59_07270 [Candidatus Poribacteria bacterium]|nr:hypothetical protein [Candidatus Poribacteria bacterium]MXY27942.1 hypothetical protein [Candidatus Poribacteria bacterium]MYK20426.1 hypothetical protein [Candidatus Poribacteria bacterium]